MWKVDLLPHLQMIALSEADGGRCPLAHPVHRQHRRFLKRRREEGAGGMALMMLGKEETPLPVVGGSVGLELFFQQGLLEQLFPEPQRNGHGEGREPAGGEREVRLQEALEFQERLVVEDDVIHLGEAAAALSEAILDRMDGKTCVVLLSYEPFLLGGRYDTPVIDEGRRAVVIKGRDAQDAHATVLRTGCRGAVPPHCPWRER